MEYLRKPLGPDVMLPRMGATIKAYALIMVRHLELLGIPVINNFHSILLARNKFLTIQTLFQNGVPILESRYASNWSNFDKAVSGLGGLPIVVKIPNSRQGRGVFLIDSMEKHRPLLSGLLDRAQGLLIQKYIPPKGDFRANIHLHGRTEKISLTREMSDLAIKSTRVLGLAIAGVDMIEEENGAVSVVDMNYSPGFKGLERCTGKDVAIEIIKYVNKIVK
jgi:ribosomal protein S6--L-glutamate ligase